MKKRRQHVNLPGNSLLFELRPVQVIVEEEMKKKRKVRPVNIAKETGQPIVFDFIFDASGSMEELYGELVDCFNTIMIPSLRVASHRYKNALRIGCLLFSSELVPAWKGFKSLEELGQTPLNIKMFQRPGLNSSTALFRAMESGVIWTAAAVKQLGSTAQGKISVLTDGANNLEPMSPQGVADILRENRGDPNYFQTSITYFKTGLGLNRPQFDEMAKTTGFTSMGFYDIVDEDGKRDIQAMRREFRHYFGIFSSQQTGQIRG